MSNDSKTDKSKQDPIVRSKQSRRKMLKSMAAGGGAVVAGKSLPEQWSYPVVDSVLLPAHADTTNIQASAGEEDPVIVCTLTGGVTATQTLSQHFDGADNGFDGFGQPEPHQGYYPLGSDTITDISGSGNMTIDPQFSVGAGVTDNFTLEYSLNGSDTPTTQNVSPLPGGGLPYNNIEVDSSYFNIQITVTPDNPDFCGGPQSLDIEFND